eukprot:6085402-Prymnesium_polylepis.1
MALCRHLANQCMFDLSYPLALVQESHQLGTRAERRAVLDSLGSSARKRVGGRRHAVGLYQVQATMASAPTLDDSRGQRPSWRLRAPAGGHTVLCCCSEGASQSMLTVLKSNGLVNRTIQAQVSVWHPPGASQVHRGRELLETVLAVLAVIILEPLGRGVDFLGRVCVFAAPGRLRDAQRRRP